MRPIRVRTWIWTLVTYLSPWVSYEILNKQCNLLLRIYCLALLQRSSVDPQGQISTANYFGIGRSNELHFLIALFLTRWYHQLLTELDFGVHQTSLHSRVELVVGFQQFFFRCVWLLAFNKVSFIDIIAGNTLSIVVANGPSGSSTTLFFCSSVIFWVDVLGSLIVVPPTWPRTSVKQRPYAGLSRLFLMVYWQEHYAGIGFWLDRLETLESARWYVFLQVGRSKSGAYRRSVITKYLQLLEAIS